MDADTDCREPSKNLSVASLDIYADLNTIAVNGAEILVWYLCEWWVYPLPRVSRGWTETGHWPQSVG